MGWKPEQYEQLREIFQQVRADIRPDIRKDYPAMPEFQSDRFIKVLAMQNVMTRSLEIMLEQAAPFDKEVVMDLTLRVAAFMITVLPIEDHEEAMMALAKHIPLFVSEKIKQGTAATNFWIRDAASVPTPNIPAKKDVN